MNEIYEKLKEKRVHLPHHKAVTYRRGEQYESIDYETLLSYVHSLSFHLQAYAQKSIAIIGHNKLEYVISLLAVTGCIGNALLIDKELQTEQMLSLFSQKKPDLILLDDDLSLSFPGYEVLMFSRLTPLMKESHDDIRIPERAGDLILHTSGTTGSPKCMTLTPENYYGVIPELHRKWKITPEDSCLFIIPLYHIYAISSLLHGLYTGIDNIFEWEYQRLPAVLSITRPHLFMGVPLMYDKVKEAVFAKTKGRIRIAIGFSNTLLRLGIDVRKKLFRGLHAYFGGSFVFGCSAGSTISKDTHQFFDDVGLTIYNVYGMTETSGCVAISYEGHSIHGSVGQILDINTVRIQDPDESGCGEICVKGSNVCRDALGAEHTDGYFCTGDLGYVKDGFLYITGRKKRILIGANGKNIAPKELEDLVLKEERIQSCTVTMEDNRLIAMIRTDLEKQSLSDLIDEINKDLPAYKRISEVRITNSRIK